MKAAPVIRGARGARRRRSGSSTPASTTTTAMSDVFFRELGLPEPDLNLGVGSGTHAGQTAAIMVALERAFARARARRWSSSTATSTRRSRRRSSRPSSGCPVAHVEAGLRSFDDTMPEEINRRVTDLLSRPAVRDAARRRSTTSRARASTAERIHFVGNPMIDTLLANLDRFDAGADRGARSASPGRTRSRRCTGRPTSTTRRRPRGSSAMLARRRATLVPLVLPLHPRGRADARGGRARRPTTGSRIVEPLGYVDFLSLVRGAALVVTDSGGIQEETTVLGVPCLTVRPEHRAADHDHPRHEPAGRARATWSPAARRALDGRVGRPRRRRRRCGTAHAGERIAAIVERWLARPGGGRLTSVGGRDRRDRVSSRGALRPACLVRGAGCATPASPVTGLEDP